MEFYVFLLWIGFTIIVGAIGRHRNIGFLYATLWSLLLSPIIGIGITLYSKKRIDHETQRRNTLTQLEQINNLKEKSILTEEQFENEKKELLEKLNNPVSDITSIRIKHLIGILLVPVIFFLGYIGISYYHNLKREKTAIEQQETSKQPDTTKTENETVLQQENTTEQYGFVRGRMYYGGEGIPNSVRLIFEDINTGKQIELDYDNCMDKDYNFKMRLPVGSYYVFEDGFPTFVNPDNEAMNDNSNKRTYYTASCNGIYNSHQKKIVKVEPFKTVREVIPCDESYK